MSQRNHSIQRCLYDVLELSRTCTEDEIRTAYRKLALRWHPDKNVDNQEEATNRFKEIQNAYAVLSDKNERAWYDSHRDAILKGANVDEGEEDEEINLWPYFSTSIYSGYGDDEGGFYFVYATIFQKIDEIEGMNHCGEAPFQSAPIFGDSKTPYAKVVLFYHHWIDFVTKRTFSFVDKYNLSTAPSRQIKRLMEKENKRERDNARKEYTDCVRQLAQFVKKRDRRILDHQLKQQKAAEDKARELAEKQKKENEQREKEMEVLKKQHEEDMKILDAQLKASGLHELAEEYDRISKKPSSSQKKKPMKGDDDEDVDELYCVACKKAFKSEQQWKNHEKSKKHIDRVAILRREVMFDDDFEEELLANNANENQAQSSQGDIEEGDSLVSPTEEDFDVGFVVQPSDYVPNLESLEVEDSRTSSKSPSTTKSTTQPKKSEKDDTESTFTKGKNRKKQKPQKQSANTATEPKKAQPSQKSKSGKGNQENLSDGEDDDEDHDVLSHMLAHMAKRTAKAPIIHESSEEEDNAEDEPDTTEGNGNHGSPQNADEDEDEDEDETSNNEDDGTDKVEAEVEPEVETETERKKKQQQQKKPQSKPATALSNSKMTSNGKSKPAQTATKPSNPADDNADDSDDSFTQKGKKSAKEKKQQKKTKEDTTPKYTCRVCSTDFASRNALFAHVKETNHAIAEGYVHPQQSAAKSKKKGK